MIATIFALASTPPPPVISDAGDTQLVLAALAGIATVVLLIVLAKLHPFLALLLNLVVQVECWRGRSGGHLSTRPGAAR